MTLQQWFADYSAFHKTRGNRLCHSIGIPLIMVGLLGLLALVNAGDGLIRLDGGIALWALATLWYLKLDWKLGASFGLVVLGCYFLARAIPLPGLVAAFGVGWVLQLVGHRKYERNAPAFLGNLRHLLIGPLWIFAKWMRLGPKT